MKSTTLLHCVAVLAFPFIANSSIVTYSQNFDSLTTAGAWANDSTLAGWHVYTSATASISTFGLNTGTTTTAGFYSFGSASASDRAIGFATSNAFTGSAGSGNNYMVLRAISNAPTSITSFSLSYDGEQWRKENNAATHSLVVEYSINATSFTDGTATWTAIPSATFASPIVGATAATAINGNDSANRQSISVPNIPVSLAEGGSLYIRWVDLNDAGNDHMLAIDNVSFTAVPEPATYALLLGALALAA
jgi:hypothetical protein